MKTFSIAIDGPSGAGKSTMAKTIAKNLGIIYLDTGALYRTVGLHVFRKGADPSSADEVVPLLSEIEIGVYPGGGGQKMTLNGEDVTTEIRKHEISHYASAVSAIPEVRAFLLDLQRDFAVKNSVIMDGRDIGTVVLPKADVKIFLTATPEDRARRRYLELSKAGQDVNYETVLRDIVERDKCDSTRAAAPLKAADDAVTIDTSGLSISESVALLTKVIGERLNVVL
ncbi:MAG: (d)CMP kinase [Bacillota bacterium]|nr:(d)CMP kinase [Bacillota bacterium]